MNLEIITPEARIFEGPADAVQLPGKDGRFQILKAQSYVFSVKH